MKKLTREDARAALNKHRSTNTILSGDNRVITMITQINDFGDGPIASVFYSVEFRGEPRIPIDVNSLDAALDLFFSPYYHG